VGGPAGLDAREPPGDEAVQNVVDPLAGERRESRDLGVRATGAEVARTRRVSARYALAS